MTFNLSTGRKALSALTVAAVISVALSPASAFAKNGHGHHGFGPAAFAGGLVLGAIVAGSAVAVADDYDAPRCWSEKRTRFDIYGDPYIQKVRVCD